MITYTFDMDMMFENTLRKSIPYLIYAPQAFKDEIIIDLQDLFAIYMRRGSDFIKLNNDINCKLDETEFSEPTINTRINEMHGAILPIQKQISDIKYRLKEQDIKIEDIGSKIIDAKIDHKKKKSAENTPKLVEVSLIDINQKIAQEEPSNRYNIQKKRDESVCYNSNAKINAELSSSKPSLPKEIDPSSPAGKIFYCLSKAEIPIPRMKIIEGTGLTPEYFAKEKDKNGRCRSEEQAKKASENCVANSITKLRRYGIDVIEDRTVKPMLYKINTAP